MLSRGTDTLEALAENTGSMSGFDSAHAASIRHTSRFFTADTAGLHSSMPGFDPGGNCWCCRLSHVFALLLYTRACWAMDVCGASLSGGWQPRAYWLLVK